MRKLITATLLSLLVLSAVGCGCRAGAATTPSSVADPDDVRIEGDRLVIDHHIRFEYDSDVIQSDSFNLLNHIVALLRNHDEISAVSVEGHSDVQGDDQHNLELSQRRAAAVAEYLRDRGVQQELTSAGFGETQTLCQEDTDECHESNRRVEFILTRSVE